MTGVQTCALPILLDTDRATRLEATVVLLIIIEIVLTLAQIFFLGSH